MRVKWAKVSLDLAKGNIFFKLICGGMWEFTLRTSHAPRSRHRIIRAGPRPSPPVRHIVKWTRKKCFPLATQWFNWIFYPHSLCFRIFLRSTLFFLHGFFGGKRFVNICEWRREWTTVLNRKRINRKVPSFAFFLLPEIKWLAPRAKGESDLLCKFDEDECAARADVHDLVMCGNFSIFLCASTVDRFVLTTTNRRSQGILLNVHTLGAVESPPRTCLFGYFFFCVVFSSHSAACKVLVYNDGFFSIWRGFVISFWIDFLSLLFHLQHWDSLAFFVNMMNKLMRCKWSAYRFFLLCQPFYTLLYQAIYMVLLSAAPQHFMYHDDVVDIADRLSIPR